MDFIMSQVKIKTLIGSFLDWGAKGIQIDESSYFI